jgi:hypothetical protein
MNELKIGDRPPNPVPTEEELESIRKVKQRMEEETKRAIERGENLPDLDPSIWDL